MRYKIVDRKKLAATFVADGLGWGLSLPWRMWRRLRLRPRFSGLEDVRSILVVRASYLGDVVMTLPMLPMLRSRFPEAQITFLTAKSAAPLLERNPHVDEILAVDAPWFYPSSWRSYADFARELRRRKFDLVIEARGDIRDIVLLAGLPHVGCRVAYGVGGGAWLLDKVVPFREVCHKVEYHRDIARYLGCAEQPLEWGLYLGEDELSEARSVLSSKGVEGRFIAFHAGSRMPLKRWPAKRWAELGTRLWKLSGLPLVLLGSKDEAGIAREVMMGMEEGVAVDLSGQLGVRALAAVIKLAELLVCHDSAPMHLAACEGIRTVAIFGPSVSQETGPFGTGHRVVEHAIACRAACNEAVCRNARYQACLQDLNVPEVLEAVKRTLGEVTS